MKHFLDSSKFVYAFDKENKANLYINSNDIVEFEAKDCFSNQIQTLDDKVESLDWSKINPSTGCVYINEAKVGDVIKAKIEKIEVKDQGVILCAKDEGALQEYIKESDCYILPIKNSLIEISGAKVPLKPMVGVIGVAPKEGKIGCSTPGNHGGNMDNTMIAQGSTIYFPVFVDGGLFALGDIHAAMGDGEVGVCGVEVAGNVTIKFEVLKGMSLKNPVVENDEFISCVASEETIGDAIDTATKDMFEILKSRTKKTEHELMMLMTSVGDAGICQVVDPKKTARFNMPKSILNQIEFKYF